MRFPLLFRAYWTLRRSWRNRAMRMRTHIEFHGHKKSQPTILASNLIRQKCTFESHTPDAPLQSASRAKSLTKNRTIGEISMDLKKNTATHGARSNGLKSRAAHIHCSASALARMIHSSNDWRSRKSPKAKPDCYSGGGEFSAKPLAARLTTTGNLCL